MNDNGTLNGNLGTSRIIELTHGRLLIKPYSLAGLAMVKGDALKRAGLEEPPIPVREVLSETLPPRPVEYTTLQELEGLEEDDRYKGWVEALMEYQERLSEVMAVESTAAARFVYMRSLFPCDENGEVLTNDFMAHELIGSGLEAPGDPYELKHKYINALLVGNQDTEVDEIGKIVTMMSWPQEDEVQAHLDSFLDHYRWTAAGLVQRVRGKANSEDGATLSDDGSGERSRGDGDVVDESVDAAGKGKPAGVVAGEKQD